MLQGRPQVSRAGWRVGAGQATSDLGPEPSGDRRSPGPTLWAEATDWTGRVTAVTVRVSGGRGAGGCGGAGPGLPHPTLGAGEGAQADSPSDGGGAGAAAGGPTSPPRRRALRSAGESAGRRARPAAEDGGPPGLPRNLSSCCGSRLRTCSTFAMFLGGGAARAGRPLRGHLGRDA